MEINQKSITAIAAALGVVAVFAVSYFMIRHKTQESLSDKSNVAASDNAESKSAPADKRAEKEKEKQKKIIEGYGGQCSTAIKFLAASAKEYKDKKGVYPISMSDMVDFEPRAAEMVDNQTHWVQNGNPEIDSFFAEKFTLAGYCADGFKYFYDSEVGKLQHERY